MRSIFLAAGLFAAATPSLAIQMPLLAQDLAPGERIITVVHATGGGPQTGAKDLRILRWVANNNWPFLKSGKTDQSVNANYLVYGRPVYAMASGTVVACWRNAPENSGPQPAARSARQQEDLPAGEPFVDQADRRPLRALCPCPDRQHPGQPVPAQRHLPDRHREERPDLERARGRSRRRRDGNRGSTPLSRRQQRQFVGAAPPRPYHRQRR